MGQTIQVNQEYDSGQGSASVIISWPGGGCASDGLGGEATFEVNQLVRSGGGATTAYAVQFFCFSSTSLVEGALANNVTPTTPKQGYYTFGSDGTISGFGNDNYLAYLGNLGATLSTPRLSAWLPPLTAAATGWWPLTAASSPTETPATTAPWER